MGTPLSSQTRRAQEVKEVWVVSKQTATAAKAWINRSSDVSSVGISRAAEWVGNIGANEDTENSLSASASTSNPLGDGPSPKYAVEDPAVYISRISWGPKSSIAAVADTLALPRKQISLPAASLDDSNEDDGVSVHHQAERGTFFGDNVRHLPDTSPTTAAEEALEMAIVPVRNPSLRQAMDPTITSLNPPPRIVPSAAPVEDPARQQVDPNIGLIEGQTPIKRKFHVQTILGIAACIVSVVGAVATVYAAFRHGSAS
ncbi:hypothetical protein FRC04_001684 [Tulasnella sp. 424]|nr:hypothetical protein FRC04_001684 [Tulasnella sp. 424]KAG8975419.1 hypothetical protein FRC05_005749 [Tulasnella sp. 425]